MDVIHCLFSSLPACLILVVIRYAEGVEDEGEYTLTINHVKISGAEAELAWEGMALSSIRHCEYSKVVNNSSIVNITRFDKPNNLTLRLTNLKPSTSYGIILVCFDTKGKAYKSSLTNFQTPAESNTSSSTTSSSPQHTLPYTSWPTTSSTVEAYRRRFTPERSPTELGLGVAFGLIGAGVFGVVGYYVIKEYRRRIRIRRFLQYRRHENETFPDLADPEDEPVDEGIGL